MLRTLIKHSFSTCLLLLLFFLVLPPYSWAETSRPGETADPQSRPPVLGGYRDYSDIKRIDPDFGMARARRTVNKTLSAKSAIVIDAGSNDTLFARNPDARRQPASTIKVLTAAIAMKALSPDQEVPVSWKAARQPSSKIYIDPRKRYLVDDLVKAVLLASANDASVALAEKIAGSEQLFAKMMTLKAKFWGAGTTICKTASGLTAKGQYSTSRDLATIFRHAMADTEFADIMARPKDKTKEGKVLRNHNKALWRISGALGGKTGYTNAARQTYVGKFKRGDDEIIVAIMGSERMWTDLERLVEFGFRKKQLLARKRLEDQSPRIAQTTSVKKVREEAL